MVRAVQRKKTFFLKKRTFALALICLMVLVSPHLFESKNKPTVIKKTAAKPQKPPSRTPFNGILKTHVFVPYWRLSGSYKAPQIPHSTASTLLYFALHPRKDGSIDTSDPGYTNLPTFAEKAAGETLLTISMQDEDISSDILEKPSLHKKLAAETIQLARDYSFSGIVLDLEYAALPTSSVISNISAFTKTFSTTAHTNNLTFSIALYGDTYYRSRPYDVKTLALYSDFIYLMAYDFHKSYGHPGPNFPLSSGKNIYPYSLETALENFLNDVPAEKLIITYGMFGYDWAIDDQNRPAKAATPRTLNQIESQFLPTCTEKDCTISIDPISAETNITFSEESGQLHSLWFENTPSLNNKIQKARSYGISNAAIWAAGYY